MIAAKQIMANGLSVSVSAEQINAAPLAYKLTAVCGQTTHEESVTFGSTEGWTVPPSVVSMQKWLDAARTRAANIASAQEQVRVMAGSLT